jgi:penicillin amidase
VGDIVWGIAVGGVLAGLAGAVAVVVVRCWPRTRGRLVVSGLDAGVRIARDRHGVPHIFARSRRDLFFAQGFVHAQDRLFQMDMQRRTGLGELAELVGPAALRVDRIHRRYGFHRAAAADLAALDADTVAVLEAYAAGVNAAIRTGRRPLEYRLLRARPRAWTPLDSVAWAKVMQWQLGDDVYRTIAREKIVDVLGPDRAAQVLADSTVYTTPRHPVLRPDRPGVAADRPWTPLAAADSDHLGSNAWAVAGSLTRSGKPIIANDLHLPLSLPGVCYEIGLHAPGFEAAGISLPGLVGVLCGHNAHIAWGIANTRARTQDIYVEHVHPTDPGRYRVPGGYAAFATKVEHIRVRGRADPDVLIVRFSRNGPIVSDGSRMGEDGRVLALRAMPLCQPGRALRALLAIGTATGWPEFTKALRDWDAPVATFVYADISGAVGSYCAGRVPVRTGGPASTPVPGWDDSRAWRGAIPFEEMPHALNPDGGVVVSANARPGGEGYSHYLAPEWCTANRESRIVEGLAAARPLTPRTMHEIQLDTLSLVARRLTPRLVAVEPSDAVVARVQQILRGWDHRMEAGSAAAGIFQVTLRMLVTGLVGPALDDPELLEFYLTRDQQYCAFVDAILDRPDSPWWTACGAGRDAHLATALDAAVRWWRGRAGADARRWTWGREHAATFRHPIYDKVPLLRRWGSAAVGPVAGDPQTPFATGFLDTLETGSGPVHRYVIDLADWESHRQMVAVGQSGHLGHRNYRDQRRLWRGGGLHPVPWCTPAIDAYAERVLRLVPESG